MTKSSFLLTSQVLIVSLPNQFINDRYTVGKHLMQIIQSICSGFTLRFVYLSLLVVLS